MPHDLLKQMEMCVPVLNGPTLLCFTTVYFGKLFASSLVFWRGVLIFHHIQHVWLKQYSYSSSRTLLRFSVALESM